MDSVLRAFVMARDGGCAARFVTMPLEQKRWPMLAALPDPGLCRGPITADHVKDRDKPSTIKAPDDPDHLWALCYGHHEGSVAGRVWATQRVVREAALDYIAAANAAVRESGWPPYPVWDEEHGRWVADRP
jgi:hypothetical protein